MNIVKAAKGEKVTPIPVWFMRQAGRYLPEYQLVRKGHTFWEVMSTVGRAAEVTMQPVRRFDLDAAIVFSDILVVYPAIGIDVDFEPVPKIPDFSLDMVERLHDFDPSVTTFQYETIAEVRARLARDKALIGFAGAPFTLACYLTGTSRTHFSKTLALLKQDTQRFTDLLKILKHAVFMHLKLQAEAGADILMLFDSWAGIANAWTYKKYIYPVTERLIAELKREIDKPLIYFINGSSHLLDLIKDFDIDVFGVDHRQDLSKASELLGDRFSLQGNLDPSDLFLPRDLLKERILDVLNQAKKVKKGYIFNLGHGVLPDTPVEKIEFMINVIRSFL